MTDLKHDIVEPKSGKTEREAPAVTVENLFRKIRLRGRNLSRIAYTVQAVFSCKWTTTDKTVTY